MTKERVCANSLTMSRRSLITALPIAGVSISLPTIAQPDSGAIINVIQELEAWQGWEPSNIIAAKAYAAYRMREVMALDLPNPKYAQLHIDGQLCEFERYQKSVWFERDRAEGKIISAPQHRYLS